jgi:hypothetical protein
MSARRDRAATSCIAASSLGLIAALYGAATLAREPAPGDGCLDARTVDRVRSLDPNSLLISAGEHRFVVAHATGCDAGTEARPSSLVAREGWVCGHEREFVRSGETLCPVISVTRIDARVYASLAAAADGATRDEDGRIKLAPVEVVVESQRGRGFRGDPDYCFAIRAVRAWNLDGRDLIVTTSRRRSGGNAKYRVELDSTCPELEWADGIHFYSTISTGWICGHAGDRVVTLQDGLNMGADPFGAAAAAQQGWTPSPGAARSSCGIAAVHPEDD